MPSVSILWRTAIKKNQATMTEIIINKKKYPVVVNMGTLISYEQITGKSILSDENGLKMAGERMVLIFAAVMSADKDTTLTLEELMKNADWKEFNDASVIVLNLLAKFFNIPDIEAEKEKKTETDDAKPKNPQPPTTTTA